MFPARLSNRFRIAFRPRAAQSLAALLGATLGLTAQATDWREFNTGGLPRSQGITVRVSHPSAWKRAELDDPMALAELRGPQGKLTAILQIGRGRQRDDMEALCKPERARTMLQNVAGGDAEARITDVLARPRDGRPAYEFRYERASPPHFLVVRSVIVCLKDSQLIVSCAGAGAVKAAVPAIEPTCSRVLETLRITED